MSNETLEKSKKFEEVEDLKDVYSIKGIDIDVRSPTCCYITMGDWEIYLDNSTNERIIDSYDRLEVIERNAVIVTKGKKIKI